jgi:hypothetical protein
LHWYLNCFAFALFPSKGVSVAICGPFPFNIAESGLEGGTDGGLLNTTGVGFWCYDYISKTTRNQDEALPKQ